MYIDMVTHTLLYIDPLGPPDEQGVAENFSYHWLEWALLHNNALPQSSVPATLRAVTTQHAAQRVSRNCGVFTMCVCNEYFFHSVLFKPRDTNLDTKVV